MSSRETRISLVKKAFKFSAQSFKNNPALFVPFVIFAALEFLAIIFLFLIPRVPLKLIFGPVIRAFWSDNFLHYPANFILLPKLVSFARMGLTVIAGSLLTAVAVAMAFNIYEGKRPGMKAAFKLALKNYISLFLIVFILNALFYFSGKAVTLALIKYFSAGHARLLFLKAGFWLGPFLVFLNFLLALVIQAAFVYAIPFLIIGREKALSAVGKSFCLYKKLFLPTVLLVALPMFLYIPIIVLSNNNVFLMDKFFPEIVLWVLFLGSAVSSLVIDPIITVSATRLYLENKR